MFDFDLICFRSAALGVEISTYTFLQVSNHIFMFQKEVDSIHLLQRT